MDSHPEIPELNLEQVVDAPLMRPVAYKFRFTFTNQDKEHTYIEDKSRLSYWRRIAQKIKAETLEKYAYLSQITGGIEYCNKLGEYTYAHLHLHFYSVAPRDTIARQYRRIFDERFDDQDTKGVKAFYLHATPTRDDLKFWRYPLKQNLDYSLSSGFPDAKLLEWHNLANDSWKIGCEVALAKADKHDTADTLFERARSKIKKINPTNKKQITVEFIKFYIDEKKPVNKNIITGYVCLYQLMEGIITPEELTDLWD